MKTTLNKIAKAVLIAGFVTTGFFAHAQYMGLETSFGVKSFSLKSDLAELASLNVTQEGGSIGVVYGNEAVRTHVQLLGLYYSSSGVSRTVDQVTSGVNVNFYPLQLVTGRSLAFSPYILTGASYNNVRFLGHYLNNPDEPVNYSTTREPYLGSVKGINAKAGIGLEWGKKIEHGFLQAFGQAVFGKSVSQSANRSEFSNTSISETVSIEVGVRFGIVKR